MLHEYSRMELLIGEDAVETLAKSRVAVFGIGGVGSYTAEALARCGVGVITLVDNDVVTLTNLNRQLVALHSTIGKPKTQVMKERIRDIDPHILVNTYETFFGPETEKMFDFSAYDYVVDAIDTVSAKLLLIEKAKAAETQIISCMGTGNKLDPSRFEIADISRTSVCPLAKVMRQELKRRRTQGEGAVFPGGSRKAAAGGRGNPGNGGTAGAGKHRFCTFCGGTDDCGGSGS